MTETGPRIGGPTARRSFTPEQKLAYLAGYEISIETNQGGAYRPALDAHEGDTLVITTLERIGRSTQNALPFADGLKV